MAITKDAEDALFDALNTAFAADTSNANGLARTNQSSGAYTSNAFCIGNYDPSASPTTRLYRRGDPKATRNFPRLEVEMSLDERDSPAYGRAEGLARFHLISNKNTPNGFASQTNVALRVRQVFHRATLSTNGGWTFSPLLRLNPVQAPGSETEQHLIIPFAVVMSAGTGGGF